MEPVAIAQPQPRKILVPRPVVVIALGLCAVSAMFLFLRFGTGRPTVDGREVPVPFLPDSSSNLAGSVTYSRTLSNGLEFYDMDFSDGTHQRAAADRVYLVRIPAGVEPVPLERVVLDGNGSPRPYYGYLYTSAQADAEIANRNATQFAARFPGVFFASADAMAAHGGDLRSFAALNGIEFRTAGPGTADHRDVLLRGPQLIALVPVDQDLVLDLAVRCGNGWKSPTEACDDGDAETGDGCSATCAVEPGFACDSNSPSACIRAAACGDGTRAPGEACDDGNAAAGDGCSAACAVEPGFACDTSLTPTRCTTTQNGSGGGTSGGDGGSGAACGNGVEDAGEECDDGNASNDDECSSVCSDRVTIRSIDVSADSDAFTVSLPGGVTGRQFFVFRFFTGANTNLGSRLEQGSGPVATFSGFRNVFLGAAGVTDFRVDAQVCPPFTVFDGTPQPWCGPVFSKEIRLIRNDNGGCGNGILNAVEQCDDGNTVAGDGCTSCAVDAGFTCDTSVVPSLCTAGYGGTGGPASNRDRVLALADANRDGSVSETEALLLTLDAAAAPDEPYDVRFDLDGDGTVSDADVLAILAELEALSPQ